jgi:hypothetical protein
MSPLQPCATHISSIKLSESMCQAVLVCSIKFIRI